MYISSILSQQVLSTQRAHAKYKNVLPMAALMVREKRPGALYKGVMPTMLRQGCNQAMNFMRYNWSKRKLLEYKWLRAKERGLDAAGVGLDHWQTLSLGECLGGWDPL
jgi:solute carrier family 25 citrate transporter 1